MIFPRITAELLIMAENKPHFEARGIEVSVSSHEIIKVVNNKVALAKLFPEYMPKQTLAHDVFDCIAFATSVGYPNKLICCKLTSKCGVNRFITLGILTELVESNDETVILRV